MAGMLRVNRSRGAFSGVLLVLLGLWGGLVPLVGPYVNYAYSPDRAWTLTHGRIWLELLPAAGTLLGGLILLVSKLRPMALFGASLAAVSGAWFALGRVLEPLWTTSPAEGTPIGGQVARTLEQVGLFAGVGVVIVCVASIALGRLSVVSIRDARVATGRVTAAGPSATGPIPVAAGKHRPTFSPAGSGTPGPTAGTNSPEPTTESPARTGVLLRKASVRGKTPVG